MYSYEDRIRAVELYIKLGKRVRPTIRQLGYPTKNSLKDWYKEYEQKLDLPMGYSGRKPKFSPTQKAAAIELYLTHDRCIAVTMRALGCPGRGTHLSPIIECFDGIVVSWNICTSPDAEVVNTMLDAAIETVADTTDRPMAHSDRGGHYRWPGWLSRMSTANLTRSMSRKACSPDNAACEGFFGRLKNELFYPRDWKCVTIEQVDHYIRWYNEKRIKISLGFLSPVEYRVSLGLAA